MSNSSSLPLTPPYCEAWPLGGWGTRSGLGGVGESPLKVTGMFVAFLREEILRFGCSTSLTIRVSPTAVRKEIT